MENKSPKLYAGVIIMLGAAWGLSEAALGMWLKNCASSVSGSVMTGFALFFIAASWLISKRASGVILLVVVASLFKLLDAFLLSLPVLHGAVANPICRSALDRGCLVVLLPLEPLACSLWSNLRPEFPPVSFRVRASLFPSFMLLWLLSCPL